MKYVVGILVGVVFGICLIIYLVGLPDEIVNAVKVISLLFIGLSSILAISQLNINLTQLKLNTNQIKYTNDWNKKQLAIAKIYESKKNLKAITTNLHNSLNLRDRKRDNPYEVYEIHNFFGCFLDDGSFIFHGEQTSEDIKKLPKNEEALENHITDFLDNINGREVQDNLWAYLDEYEYICSAINNEIFDKNTVTNLMGEAIISTYCKFYKYTQHLRQDKNHIHKNAYIEIENLAKELIKERGGCTPSN